MGRVLSFACVGVLVFVDFAIDKYTCMALNTHINKLCTALHTYGFSRRARLERSAMRSAHTIAVETRRESRVPGNPRGPRTARAALFYESCILPRTFEAVYTSWKLQAGSIGIQL